MYSQYGMFSADGVRYVPLRDGGVGKRGEEVVERGGRVGAWRVAEYTAANLVVLAVMLCLLLLEMATWVAVRFIETRSGEFDEAARWVVASTLRFTAVLVVTWLVGYSFRWEGRSTATFQFVCGIGVVFPMLQTNTLAIENVIAAVLMNYALACFRVAVRTGSIGFVNLLGVVALLLYVVYNTAWLCGFPVVVFVMEHKWGDVVRYVKASAVVDQRAVVVDNSNVVQGWTQMQMSARTMVPLDYANVPDDVLRAVMYRAQIDKDTASFRRWAALGDAVMKLSLVRSGVEKSATVAQINVNFQRRASRASLGVVIRETQWARLWLLDAQGILPNSICAEVAEALAGVAFKYAYDMGRDDRWHEHMAMFLERCDCEVRRLEKSGGD